MTTPKSPPPGSGGSGSGPSSGGKAAGAKLFLGDDDLSELDAWVETFDALHAGIEPPAAPVEPPQLALPEDDSGADEAPTGSELAGLDMSDAAATREAAAYRPDHELRPFDSSRAPSVTAIDSFAPADDGDTAFATPDPDLAVPMASPQPVGLPRLFRAAQSSGAGDDLVDDLADEDAFGDDEDDEEVFTSASRPGVPPGELPGDALESPPESRPERGPDLALDSEDLAPPPPVPERRRGPAIVRRTPPRAMTPTYDEAQDAGQHDSDSMFSEQTRVADFAELEQRLFSSRAAQPTVPADEDDYLDIEVSDDKSAIPEVGAFEPYPTGRRTAHVVRREAGSRSPSDSVPIVQLDLEDDRPRSRAPSQPIAEDDFSDVAAEVRAEVRVEDVAVPDLGRGPVSRPIRAPSIPEITGDAHPRANLDDALAGLRAEDSSEFDDAHPFDEPQVFDEPRRFTESGEFDPNQFDGPDQFADPARYADEFDEPGAFDAPDRAVTPNPFAEPERFVEGEPFVAPEPARFDDPARFDEPDAFAQPPRFDEPGAYESRGAFDDPDQFDEPHPFDEPEPAPPAPAPPAPALPPITAPLPATMPPVIPPPGERPFVRTLPPLRRPEQSMISETVRGVSIAQLTEGPGVLRPPALTDLYPRVKTPTSVPPIGAPAQSPLVQPPPPQPTPVPALRVPAVSTTPPPVAGQPVPAAPATPAAPPASSPALAIPPIAPTRTLLEFGPQPTVEPPPPERPSQPPRSTRLATPLPIDASSTSEVEPQLDLDTIARGWPSQVSPLPTATLDEAFAQALLVYEREIATVDDSASSAALRVEAGRLCERLTDFERARGHYDAALMVDPRATAALRGLRRLARTSGDLTEAIQHLDAEIAVAGALERRPLGHYRVDLMMASNEQDLARVAAGEILDQAPSDVRALLAQLELAFLDGRADEFGVALEQLAQAVSDTELRAALQSARGVLAAHHNDTGAAASWFGAAAESDPTALAALLGAIRQATAANHAESASRALIDLARQVESSDPITAAAAAIRAQQWAELGEPGQPGDAEARSALGTTAMALATSAAPLDPLVARLSAHHADGGADPIGAANAFIHWAHNAGSNPERAYAAARAAELDPARGNELWASAIALDPGDDYAAAQLRTAHVAVEATQAAIEVDLALAVDGSRERARLRAAYGLIAQGQLDAAIEVLQQGREARPGSIALGDALGEALAAAGKWTERAKLFADLAEDPGEHVDREVAELRSALAWEEAVGAAASAPEAESEAGANGKAGLVLAITAALDAWDRVLGRGSSPSAHAAAIVLASRLGDPALLGDALARAQAVERLPLAATSLALRRARLVASEDLQRHDAILDSLLRDLPATADDPRRTLGLVVSAARRHELADAAAALEERAQLLAARGAGRSDGDVAALRLRAAQLALDAGEAVRATALLDQVEQALPQLGIVPDLLAAARRRAGDRPMVKPGRQADPTGAAASADAFVRVVRDGDLAAAQGDLSGALALYQRALELRPGDPLAAVPLARVATQLREPAPLSALALAQLRVAEQAGDHAGKAAAYELLAQIDGELRADPGSAQLALESAAQADPSRIDVLHRLARHYAAADQLSELIRLRTIELDATPAELARDRAALLVDLAAITSRDGRPEVEIADLYRRVLAIEPRTRLALLHLESIVRRTGFSAELAELEDRIAAYFDGDPRTCAAFYTRAGETLADLGRIDEAVQRFGKADAVFPGHVPALEGWRQAALKGQLWIDVAEAATRQAAGVTGPARAALHHFAGVALMDKALVGDQAMAAFRRALEADHGHRDAFLRLRILLDEDANHDDLATLLAMRLEVETDPAARIELSRALAELHRNFLSDRDTAKRHYRAILEADPNDLRAHAAIADIAWEQGNWQEAADALMARARLERAPDVLRTLCFRLGLIYADRLVDVPMALKAFHRALAYQPDDEATLVRLADLAVQVGEWKLALGACERLVKNESDPDRRAAHLHRVAKIFQHGFGDIKRAERALNLALDGAPTNDEALTQLVQFYRDANDMTSVRVHLNRVAGAMRARVTSDPRDGVAYRVISRAMAARAAANVPGSLPIARAAAELADLLGAAGEAEHRLIQAPRQPDLPLLIRPEADEVLFPRGVPIELRHIFQLLGDRIAKHVGVDLRPYGVTRGDRQRARDNPVASVAQSVATGLGFGDIDVYVSSRQPQVMVAEPTSPVSLILGSGIAAAGGDAIRFAAGAALKLAQSSLAIAARLPPDDLGVLVVALLRLFQPDFPVLDVDGDAVAAQTQKLRRLIPTGLMNELKPFALAIDPQRFRHSELSRDLKIAGLRAGLVASGSLLAGLRIIASQVGGELPGFLGDPIAQGLIGFALGEDHAAVTR